MKIFNASQIKQWDDHTILHEPVTSEDLMERAARKCFGWIEENKFLEKPFKIICGHGNNGGDGLALGRMLLESGARVNVFVVDPTKKGSKDFNSNLDRFSALQEIQYITGAHDLPVITTGDVVIDAMFGTGLREPLTGLYETITDYLNATSATVISIDIPSGMFADKSSALNPVVKATYTLTFQQYKMAFLLPSNALQAGRVILLDISLDPEFYNETKSRFELIDKKLVASIYKPRDPFSHKGNFGHALVIAGSYGMMGAAVLCTRAALRSGGGKVSAAIPEKGYEIMQGSVPEAMTVISGHKYIRHIVLDQPYQAIGIGPGMGRHSSFGQLLKDLFASYHKPIVLDADALNQLSSTPELLAFIPEGSILTPHPKEFNTLFGASVNDFAMLELAIEKASRYKVYIILKGHHSFIACPNGYGYFNSTGNAGMATGGSGDVLTGILTGLLAQGYSATSASILGVYLHGLAGDIAAREISQEALIAGDLVNYLGKAFLAFNI